MRQDGKTSVEQSRFDNHLDLEREAVASRTWDSVGG